MSKWDIIVEETTRYLVVVEADNEEDAVYAFDSDAYVNRIEIKYHSDIISVEPSNV